MSEPTYVVAMREINLYDSTTSKLLMTVECDSDEELDQICEENNLEIITVRLPLFDNNLIAAYEEAKTEIAQLRTALSKLLKKRLGLVQHLGSCDRETVEKYHKEIL